VVCIPRPLRQREPWCALQVYPRRPCAEGRISSYDALRALFTPQIWRHLLVFVRRALRLPHMGSSPQRRWMLKERSLVVLSCVVGCVSGFLVCSGGVSAVRDFLCLENSVCTEQFLGCIAYGLIFGVYLADGFGALQLFCPAPQSRVLVCGSGPCNRRPLSVSRWPT
jgi:hypothetical protein